MKDDYVKRSDVHKAFQPKYAPAINRTFAVMIDSVPAADVVAVVRCRECIYWRGENDLCKGICIDFGADGYCSEGKRKDGGQGDENT